MQRRQKRFQWVHFRLYLLAIPFISAIITLMEFNPDMRIWGVDALQNVILTLCITLTMYLFIELLNLTLIRFRILFLLKLLAVYIFSGTFGGLLAWKINVWLFDFNVTHPVYFLILTSSLSLIFGITIIFYASVLERLKNTAAQLLEKEIAEERLKGLKIRAELEALRAKVNPHFFFNTLNSIASLIAINPEEAEHLIERLSRLFRYSLDASNTDFVTLGLEVEMINEYLQIEKIRLGDRFTYQIECDNTLFAIKVPGMLLQPLVENSIIHGISNLTQGGQINLHFEIRKEVLTVILVDNGPGLSEGGHEGFGLRGVRERLELLFPQQYQFKISSDEGCKIHLEFPVNSVE